GFRTSKSAISTSTTDIGVQIAKAALVTNSSTSSSSSSPSCSSTAAPPSSFPVTTSLKAGEAVRRELLKKADVHTLLRLPTGIFYAQTRPELYCEHADSSQMIVSGPCER